MSATKSTAQNDAPKPKNKTVPVIAGTAGLALVGALVMQFVRAEPGAVQTAAAAQQSALQTAQRSLGRVNGQDISYDEVAEQCVQQHGAEVLDTFINRMIIAQECQKRGITVTESEIVNKVKEIAGNFDIDPSNWYQMQQTEQGLSPQQYHQNIIWPMLALKKLAGDTIELSEADMQTAFERDYGPRVRARMIMINGNIRQATEVWEKCVATPDKFDRLAQEHSSDSNTRSLGGMVPPIRQHGGSPVLEEQAFRLEAGEISSVIQTGESQYVILKCEGRTEPVVTDIQEVWDEIYESLKEEKVQESVAVTFSQLRDQADVMNYITGEKSTGSSLQHASAVTPSNR